MFTPFRPVIIGVITLALFIVSKAGVTQEGRRPQNERVHAEGTVEGLHAGVIQVVTEEGDRYLVRVADRPQEVRFKATADPGWLKAGMYVQFVGQFNKKGQAQEAIDELTIFTPSIEFPIGVIPDSAPRGEAEQNLPVQADRKTLSDQINSYRVSGRLVSLHAGKMTVAAGRASVKADLSESARVSLEIADLRFIRKGDKVELDGWAVPNQKQLIVANSLTVTAAQPLTSSEGAAKKGAIDQSEPATKPDNPE